MQNNANASKTEFIIMVVEMHHSVKIFFFWHQWSVSIEIKKLNNFNESLKEGAINEINDLIAKLT